MVKATRTIHVLTDKKRSDSGRGDSDRRKGSRREWGSYSDRPDERSDHFRSPDAV